MMIRRALHWPLHVHGVLAVWLSYVVAMFFSVPDYASTLAMHVFILSLPAWYLGRAMAGVYDKPGDGS